MLTARAMSGQLTPSSETSEVRWVPLDQVGGYRMAASMRMRVEHLLQHRDRPYIG